jgi:biopolymer transport protein ExbB
MNSVVEFIQHGGVMMWPLVFCSVVLIAIVVERSITIRKNTTDPEQLLDDVRELYQPGQDPSKAIAAAEREGSIGRIFARGLRNANRSADAIEMTIAGMIASFRSAGQNGLSNPTGLLAGISEALISTATGITLAVVGFCCYNYFANLVRKSIEDIEYYGAELVNYMTGRLD